MKSIVIIVTVLLSIACSPAPMVARSGSLKSTAFYGPDGNVYTALHGVASENVELLTGLTEQVATHVYNAGNDIAVLEPGIPYKSRIGFCSGKPRVGDRVKVIKNSGIRYGEIVSIDDKNNTIYTDLTTKKGDSGAPVIDIRNRCILAIHVGFDDGFAVHEIIR